MCGGFIATVLFFVDGSLFELPGDDVVVVGGGVGDAAVTAASAIFLCSSPHSNAFNSTVSLVRIALFFDSFASSVLTFAHVSSILRSINSVWQCKSFWFVVTVVSIDSDGDAIVSPQQSFTNTLAFCMPTGEFGLFYYFIFTNGLFIVSKGKGSVPEITLSLRDIIKLVASCYAGGVCSCVCVCVVCIPRRYFLFFLFLNLNNRKHNGYMRIVMLADDSQCLHFGHRFNSCIHFSLIYSALFSFHFIQYIHKGDLNEKHSVFLVSFICLKLKPLELLSAFIPSCYFETSLFFCLILFHFILFCFVLLSILLLSLWLLGQLCVSFFSTILNTVII